MRRLVVALALGLVAATAYAEEPVPEVVDVVDLAGPVTPVMADYLERGIAEATKDDARLLVVRLNTPGGSVDVMDRMSAAMRRSPVPVAVWVAPKGAMAASAGTFLVLSGHVAAMAPGTSIGAASPVDEHGQDLGETMRRKATNMLATKIRGLAAARGKPAERWAEAAVRDAAAATADEALALGVVDAIAADRAELLAKLEGRTVALGGDVVPLHFDAGVAVREIEMTGVERFLQTLANPTLAFVLIVLGMNGVLFELASPGAVLPGVIGGVCLLMGFYAIGVLPVNYAGLLLVALAFVLFLVDVKAPTHGALTLGGVVTLVFGATVLFQSPLYEVSRSVLFTVAAGTGAFFLFAVGAAVRTGRRRPTTGREGLVGARGTSRARLDPVGNVMVEGELWRATADDGPIDAGTPVTVVAVDGLALRVRRAP